MIGSGGVGDIDTELIEEEVARVTVVGVRHDREAEVGICELRDTPCVPPGVSRATEGIGGDGVRHITG
jgi:hypothetical protein